MDVSKLKSILLTFGAIVLLGLLTLVLVRVTTVNNPGDSDVLYGGQLEAGYPYAGYLLGFANSKVNICGAVFLADNKVLTAAHCVDKQATQTVVGTGQLETIAGGKNTEVNKITVKTGWDGKTSNNDLAIVNTARATQMTKFAEIGSPELGCNYTVVAYGRTEKNELGDDSERPRKSAKLCINRIERDLIFLSGNDSGICFGDSGSPIFLQNSNKIIGVISAIVANSQDGSPCHIANQAVAVRVDANQNFIANASGISIATSNKSICGAECGNQTCGIGLVCGTNNRCQLAANGSCFARIDEYCDDAVNISCQSDMQCLNNKCVTFNQANGQVGGNNFVQGTQLNVNALIVTAFIFVDILVIISLVRSLISRRRIKAQQTNDDSPPINTTRLTV